MGWNGATEIMDVALAAAEQTVKATLDAAEGGKMSVAWPRQRTDDLLRDFVRTVATYLRGEDWDSIQGSEYFDRFSQEMLGHNNVGHEEWLIQKVLHTRAAPVWVARLTDFRTRIAEEAQAGKHRGED